MWSPLGQTFFAPYDPYASQPNGSLLPPTRVYLRNQQTGDWIGPHVYPTTQGPVSLETGAREIQVDFSQPSPIRILHRDDSGQLKLFDTAGPGKWNILGTDEQARDQFSRLLHGSRVSLFVGLIGIAISFPLGMLIGGMAGYFWRRGAVDAGTDAVLSKC